MVFFIRLILAATAMCVAFPAASQSAQDFRLPPNPQPTQTQRAQGPIDTEGANPPAAPRVIETSRPAASRTPQPAQTVQPAPVRTPAAAPARDAAPLPRQTSPALRPQPTPLSTQSPRLPLDPGETTPIVPEPQVVPTAEPVIAQPDRQATAPASTLSDEEAGDETKAFSGFSLLPWLAVALGVLALAYGILSRRRQSPPATIERPVVGRASTIEPRHLAILAEPIKLTRSVMNATLHYRVTLINRASQAVAGVSVGADIVSAHGQVPVEEQVASPAQTLQTRHVFARIAPGQTVRYDGQISLPLAQVRAIRQANASLFVPLLRLRVDGACAEPLVRTFVIGAGVPGSGRVLPFRLDEGPRSWEPVAARALD